MGDKDIVPVFGGVEFAEVEGTEEVEREQRAAKTEPFAGLVSGDAPTAGIFVGEIDASAAVGGDGSDQPCLRVVSYFREPPDSVPADEDIALHDDEMRSVGDRLLLRQLQDKQVVRRGMVSEILQIDERERQLAGKALKGSGVVRSGEIVEDGKPQPRITNGTHRLGGSADRVFDRHYDMERLHTMRQEF